MQKIYRRTPMPKCDFRTLLCNFIEITIWHGCSPANLSHIFRTSFSNNTSGWLLLKLSKTLKFTQFWNSPNGKAARQTRVVLTRLTSELLKKHSPWIHLKGIYSEASFRKKAHSVNLLKKYCVTCVFLRMVKIFLGYLICTILANTWF